MSPNIDTNDLNTKIGAARKFLSKGNKVKVSIRFRGRELAHTEESKPMLEEFAKELADIAVVEKPAKMEGRFMTGAMIQQFVREEPSSDSVYKTNVLLKAEPPQVQDACYEMVHSYLTSLHSAERKS